MSQTILLDSNSLITRCIMASALDDLQAGGLYTGGVYGALNSLRAILARPDIEADSVFAFFDHGVPEFRKLLFGEFYKEKRKKRKELMSEEEREKAFSQLHTTRLLFETLGVVCVAYHEREADDCLGAAVACVLSDESKSEAPIVVSGDKDMWQMIAWGAKMWDINKNRWIDEDILMDEAGVAPKHYLLWKAMVGDASDCIPGVRGVGPKKAAQVIAEFADEMENQCEFGMALEYARALVLNLEVKSKRLKFEDQIIEQAEWLECALIGIDLYSSFGKLTGLKKAMDERRPPVNKLKFLKMCKRLHFKSVLGDPNKFLNPFLAAADRR